MGATHSRRANPARSLKKSKASRRSSNENDTVIEPEVEVQEVAAEPLRVTVKIAPPPPLQLEPMKPQISVISVSEVVHFNVDVLAALTVQPTVSQASLPSLPSTDSLNPSRVSSLKTLSSNPSQASLAKSLSSSKSLASFNSQSSLADVALRSPRGNAISASRLSGSRTHNSTMNIFVDTTMSSLALRPLLNCVGSLLLSHILATEADTETKYKTIEIFDESTHPTVVAGGPLEVPTATEIVDFLTPLFEVLELQAGPALMMLIYLERLRTSEAHGPVAFNALTWRRMVLASIVLTAKVIDDLAVWSSDACLAAGLHDFVDADDVNMLERACLRLLAYDVNVRANSYASAYFALREHAIQRNLEFHDNNQLNDDARAAEQVSLKYHHTKASNFYGRSSDQLHELRRSVSDICLSTTRSVDDGLDLIASPVRAQMMLV